MTYLLHRPRLPPSLLLLLDQRPNHCPGNRPRRLLLLRRRRLTCPTPVIRHGRRIPARHRITRTRTRAAGLADNTANRDEGGAVQGVGGVDEGVRGDGGGEREEVLEGDSCFAAAGDAVVEGVGCWVGGGGAELEDCAADGGAGLGAGIWDFVSSGGGGGGGGGRGKRREQHVRVWLNWIGMNWEEATRDGIGTSWVFKSEVCNFENIPHRCTDSAGSSAQIRFGRGVAACGRGIDIAFVGEVDVSITSCGGAGAAYGVFVSRCIGRIGTRSIYIHPKANLAELYAHAYAPEQVKLYSPLPSTYPHVLGYLDSACRRKSLSSGFELATTSN